MTPPPKTTNRTSVSELAKMLAERRQAAAPSVSIKMGAGGVVVPDITVTPDTDDATLNRMVAQALSAFTAILRATTE
jgi:hypothetical protein